MTTAATSSAQPPCSYTSISTSSASSSSSPVTMIPSTFEKVSEIPKYCTKLAAMLAAQPLFDGYGLCNMKCKVIPLGSWDDTRIYDIFNDNAVKILGNESAWPIAGFGGAFYSCCDSRGQSIHQGLILRLHENDQMCSLTTLEKAYNQAFQNMSTGWTSAKLEDNCDIFPKANSNEFDLFIKKKSLLEEDALMRLIASKFSFFNIFAMENDVTCCADRSPNGKVYLLVKKSALKAFSDKLGFKL